MPQPAQEISCPGCLRIGKTANPRFYCPECHEDLEKQACVLCSTPVTTDVPYALCDDCLEDCRQYAAGDLEADQ